MTAIDSGTVRTRERGGDGTPILLLHGIGGGSASFGEQLATFSRDHRVRAWDAPGYGESADPAAAPGMDGYADAAAALLQEEPAHVLGVSWGGVIATRLAARHPDLVRSLVLADSSRGSGAAAGGAERMRARAAELAASGATEFARARGPRLASPLAPPSVVDRIVATMSRVRLPGYRFAAESMAETDHIGLLGAITAPTLVVAGEHDRVTGVCESRRIAEGVPGARLEVLPNAGHAANQEIPDVFNRVVSDFVAEVDAIRAVEGAAL